MIPKMAPDSLSYSGMHLQALCRKVLRVQPERLDQNLFEVGLNSLSAASLAWLIEQEFNVRIRLSEILNNPTIRKLLASIEIGQRHGRGVRVSNMSMVCRIPSRFRFPLLRSRSGFLKSCILNLTAIVFRLSSIVSARSTRMFLKGVSIELSAGMKFFARLSSPTMANHHARKSERIFLWSCPAKICVCFPKKLETRNCIAGSTRNYSAPLLQARRRSSDGASTDSASRNIVSCTPSITSCMTAGHTGFFSRSSMQRIALS